MCERGRGSARGCRPGALLNAGKVLEIDAAGKTLWECSVAGASHATRLPNGHTLITSMTNRRVVEVDREGRPEGRGGYIVDKTFRS
jgi:hypothetical protein